MYNECNCGRDETRNITLKSIFQLQAHSEAVDDDDQSAQTKKTTSRRKKPAYAGGLVLEPKKGITESVHV